MRKLFVLFTMLMSIGCAEVDRHYPPREYFSGEHEVCEKLYTEMSLNPSFNLKFEVCHLQFQRCFPHTLEVRGDQFKVYEGRQRYERDLSGQSHWIKGGCFVKFLEDSTVEVVPE